VNQSEDHQQEVDDALHSSRNAAVLCAIAVAFGVLWVTELDGIPTWFAALWFIVVIPLNLYLVYSSRRRYRRLRDE
jgi:Flp pilus assembly protein TadB